MKCRKYLHHIVRTLYIYLIEAYRLSRHFGFGSGERALEDFVGRWQVFWQSEQFDRILKPHSYRHYPETCTSICRLHLRISQARAPGIQELGFQAVRSQKARRPLLTCLSDTAFF